MQKYTIRQAYPGGHRPGMFITLTMPSYGRINRDGAIDHEGKVCSDGSPINPSTYDYVQAARDIVHFSRLFDRWIQNMRRAVGYNLQYYATVEPQKRGAPHLHILIRTDIPRELIRKVTDATYHQVWWPHFDHPAYTGEVMPVWDPKALTFTDPHTQRPLQSWDEALDVMDSVDDLEPAHVLRFGVQVDPRHIRGVVPGAEADKTIRYVTKYLTKSIAEVLDTDSERTAVHYDRLHAELQRTPCSPRGARCGCATASCPRARPTKRSRAAARAKRTAETPSASRGGGCWSRGTGRARPCPTTNRTAPISFGNSSPRSASSNPTAPT
ncbi:Helitron helicase-like domain at N-terminus [Nocardia amikacinitolerans]|nr:Helitron helicase-like domain at N-terminus [Nocardia amikacinitolerans]